MFWKRKTTTTTTIPAAGPISSQDRPQATTTTTTTAGPISSQDRPQAVPIVQAVPVVSAADAPILNAPTYHRPYEPIVPVPVTSVTDAGLTNVATADRTYQPDVRRSYSLMRITQFIWLIAGVLETLFAVRIILRLLVANPAAGFDQFITNVTAPFLTPFVGLLSNPTVSNGSVLEITTLIAMLVYALLAWGIVRLLWIVFERRIAR